MTTIFVSSPRIYSTCSSEEEAYDECTFGEPPLQLSPEFVPSLTTYLPSQPPQRSTEDFS